MSAFRILVFAVVASLASLARPATAAETQHWKGQVDLPTGMKLEFTVVLGDAGGTISIPMQGAKDIPLREGTTDGPSLKFVLAPPGAAEAAWAKFDMTIAEDGATAKGTLSQVGQTFPVTMARVSAEEAAAVGPKRPQTPKPPFPYTADDVTFVNAASKITLAGTLTIPEGPGPHPAVTLLTGSGPQDRDEAIFDHRPFAVIADHLTRRGIAVLRWDDRGIGGSTGNSMLATADDLASDALAAVEYLRGRSEINADMIGLAGHSEGGGIAPLAASKSGHVKFLVLLAGCGLPGRDVMRTQSAAIARAEANADEAALAEIDALHAKMTASFVEGSPPEEQRAAMRALTEAQYRAMGQAMPEGAPLEAAISQQMIAMNTPWMRSFMTHDPRESLKRVRVPVLALNGSLDLQVLPKENLGAIETALKEAGNGDVTIREMPGLNHLFQTTTTGRPTEYGEIEETFSPAALEAMTAWIRGKTGLN